MDSVFFDIGLVIIATGICGALGFFLKQPPIVAYVLAGIILGPMVSGIIADHHFIESVSHIGIVLMLFLIGLEMHTGKLKSMGGRALGIAFTKIISIGLLAWLSFAFFGISGMSLVYLAVGLSFSSMVIAIKLLTEKRDLSSFYGQATVGTLLIQDIIAIIAIVLLTKVIGENGFDAYRFFSIFTGGILLALFTMLFARHVLTFLMTRLANSTELLILASLSWCFIVAMLAQQIGLSMEIGAFIAGVNLANLPYTFEINAKSKPLRDFFVTLFFVAIGMGLAISDINTLIWPALLAIVLVVLINPVVVMCVMGIAGYDKRNSFLAALMTANVSEFSLILLAMGAKLGHVDSFTLSLLTIVFIISMMLSSYMITYNAKLYTWVKPILHFIEKKTGRLKVKTNLKLNDHVILLGFGDTGRHIYKELRKHHEHILVVDHNNQVIRELLEENIPCIFGDVEDEELVEELALHEAKLIINTVPHPEDSYYILKAIQELPEAKRPVVISIAENGKNGLALFVKGADYVIVKSYLGASHIKVLHKQLFNIKQEGQYTLEEITKDPSKMSYAQDIDYAVFLENLNAMRFDEIKEKLQNGTIK